MDNVIPIRPGIRPGVPPAPTGLVAPAAQASSPPSAPASSNPSPWLVLGVVFVSIAAYEGIKYFARSSAPAPATYRRRYG